MSLNMGLVKTEVTEGKKAAILWLCFRISNEKEASPGPGSWGELASKCYSILGMSFETESRARIWKERVCSLTEEWKRIDKGGDLRRVTCGKAVVPHDIPVEIWGKKSRSSWFLEQTVWHGFKADQPNNVLQIQTNWWSPTNESSSAQ